MKYVVAILAGLVAAALVAWGLTSLMSLGDGKQSLPGALWFAPVFVGVVTAYILANLAGNRRSPGASVEARAAALAFMAQPGKARLYVLREGFVGMAAGLNITLDGAPLAQLKAPRFLSIEVDPGRHLLGAAFGGLAAAQNKAAEYLIELQPGEVAVVRAALSMGAISNTIALRPEPLDDRLRRKLAGMTMVAA